MNHTIDYLVLFSNSMISNLATDQSWVIYSLPAFKYAMKIICTYVCSYMKWKLLIIQDLLHCYIWETYLATYGYMLQVATVATVAI